MFAGDRGSKLARDRSPSAAEPAVLAAALSGRNWRSFIQCAQLASDVQLAGGARSCFGGRPKLAGAAARSWRKGRTFMGGAAGGGGASPKCRGGMPGRETGGAARSWREVRSCFWGGGPGLGAKCPVLAGVTQSWRIARSCLKSFTPFRTSQDR
jgi:hypothetical protein